MMAATRQREICDSSIKLPLGAWYCPLGQFLMHAIEFARRQCRGGMEFDLRCTGEAATRSGLTNREPTISKPANAASSTSGGTN